jgi:hypothetical protein
MKTYWNTIPVVAAILAAVLAGCASGVKHADDTAKREAYFAGGGKVAREVTLSLDKNAQAQLSSELKFDQGRLLSTVRQALDARGLLAKSPDPSQPGIEIVVTDIRVRSKFSAVMFGFMAGDDRIVGDVIARDHSGKELQRFTVTASYALGGFAGGQDETRMRWLYETFAKELVNEITGAARN